MTAAVSPTAKSSRQDLLLQTLLNFSSSSVVGGKAAVTESCARYLQLQTHKRLAKYKGNLEQLQGVPYLQVLAGDCGRESKLFSWHTFPDSGTQRESASGD